MYPSPLNEQYAPIDYRNPNAPTPSPSPESTPELEPFPTVLFVGLVVAVATVVSGVGLLVYLKKRK